MALHTDNINISSTEVIITPDDLKAQIPVSQSLQESIIKHRNILKDILDGKDDRLFLVVGPCSIHDPLSAIEYATKLKVLADEVSDSIVLIMRVYFEKPRTTTGWKGFINDPDLNGSFNISKGLLEARKLMVKLADLGLPLATEALDPISPQYLADLISWSAIGARTTESQTHREMASGLSSPVGFKNATDGSLKIAFDALQTVSSPHSFLGINRSGQVAIVRTRGNAYGHIVLRGGAGKPNYQIGTIKECEKALLARDLTTNLVIDCSHENSNKNPENQASVFNYCIEKRLEGTRAIVGMMLESNLNEGNQKIPDDLSSLKYGVSITDACIDWKTTEKIIRNAAKKLNPSHL